MDFDAPHIIIGLLFSAVGFVYSWYGKKQSEFKFLLCGFGLMFFEYFVNSIPLTLLIGAALTAVPIIWK